MLTVGQKHGPPYAGLEFLGIRLGKLYWRSSRSRDAKEACLGIGRKDDHAIAVPGTAASVRRVGNDLYLSLLNVHLFEFAVGKKAESFTVWRPKGIRSSLGAINRLRLLPPDAIQPEG